MNKTPRNDGIVDDDTLHELKEMKQLLSKCFAKVNSIETSNEETNVKLSGMMNKTPNAVTSKLKKIADAVQLVDNTVKMQSKSLDLVDTKLDKNVSSIDDGLQKSFHKLADLTERLYSPVTPRRSHGVFGRESSIRKTAMGNRARASNINGTPASAFSMGSTIPTGPGTATDENVFGPPVARRLNLDDGENQNLTQQQKKEFSHADVDGSIRPDQMSQIMKRNDTIKEEIERNPEAIEITDRKGYLCELCCASTLAKPIALLFNKSLSNGALPTSLKTSLITP